MFQKRQLITSKLFEIPESFVIDKRWIKFTQLVKTESVGKILALFQPPFIVSDIQNIKVY